MNYNLPGQQCLWEHAEHAEEKVDKARTWPSNAVHVTRVLRILQMPSAANINTTVCAHILSTIPHVHTLHPNKIQSQPLFLTLNYTLSMRHYSRSSMMSQTKKPKNKSVVIISGNTRLERCVLLQQRKFINFDSVLLGLGFAGPRRTERPAWSWLNPQRLNQADPRSVRSRTPSANTANQHIAEHCHLNYTPTHTHGITIALSTERIGRDFVLLIVVILSLPHYTGSDYIKINILK